MLNAQQWRAANLKKAYQKWPGIIREGIKVWQQQPGAPELTALLKCCCLMNPDDRIHTGGGTVAPAVSDSTGVAHPAHPKREEQLLLLPALLHVPVHRDATLEMSHGFTESF